MKVEVTKIDKLKRVIKVNVGGEKFAKDKNEFYTHAAKDIQVSGFRKGAAPMDIVEKHYGKALKEEFIKNYVSNYYGQALDENKIAVAGMPRIFDVEIDDTSLKFSAEVETRPELELDDKVYKGIVIKEKFPAVEEKDVEKVVDGIKAALKKLTGNDLEGDILAHWSGHSNLVALKDSIKAELLVEKLRQRRLKVDEAVAQHLLKEITLELPKSEVDNYQHELVHRQVHNLEERGVSKEDIEKYKKELEDKMRPRAQDEVKLFYILRAIATKENLKIEKDSNLGEIVLGFVLSQATYK